MYRAMDVANYIIGYTNSMEKPVTNLKLQKMLYFIQGFSYSKRDEAFISDDFEAWRYGPVVRDVYIEFSRYGSLLITDFYNSNYQNINFEKKDKEFLDDMIQSLNNYSTSKLVSASHAKDSPWALAYNNSDKSLISKEDIKNYFKGFR